MGVSRERFLTGLTYEQYKQQMTRNRDRLEANERKLQLRDEDVAAFRNLPESLPVLVLAEDWCGDVIANLPILGRLAAESDKLDVRVFLRDRNLDLMDQYLNQGKFRSIPVFVFFDRDFRELGRFVERPASVTELRERRRAALYAAHPEWGSPETPIDRLSEAARASLQQAMAELRAETAQDASGAVVRDLRAIVEKVGE